ncbi:MAG: hybrid sensor histidine kinase/response regulator [Planctomycetes bacterium]|nr:hybrid sensor histidine kinase/response regulator [Planctomycetota bacterium]
MGIATPTPRKSKVLVVDDSAEIRDFLTSYLDFLGFDVVSASDGREGLLKAQESKPDILISDVVMPHISGIELCRQLKGTPATALTPVILITALDDRDSRIHGLEAGADEFLVKPIDPHELQARVRSLLRQTNLQRELAQASRTTTGGTVLKEELTRILVHDMNNFLSGILGNIHMLELWRSKLDEKQLKAVDAAKKSCRELLDLLGDLREMVRLENGGHIVVKHASKLEDLVVETVEQVSRADHLRGKDLQAEPCGGTAPVEMEVKLIRRALAVLIEVAAKTAEDRVVRLAVRPSPERGVVEAVVAFKGLLLPDELTAMAFDATGSVKARESGYVLDRCFSLLFVAVVAHCHRGNVLLQNLGGGDSRFVLTLPLAPPS